ncbi:MAG: hypothetical protein OEZ39_02595 [Gammaproteobacteria bacterium]|nr:hypothetical protein [Gammaproteobacteria bacterium]MDH5650744.1 hypothetical protein [Gammaproteobacteria bacterium]
MSATALKISTTILQPASSRLHAAAPATGLPYNPRLIADLRRSNRNILAWIKLVLIKIKSGDLEKSLQLLAEMRKVVLDQFMLENNALLLYIKSLHQDNPLTINLIKLLKREMACVQSMVMYFFNTYLDAEVTRLHLRGMRRELYVVGKVMYWRIKRLEKQLYPLYLAPRIS